MVRIILPTKYAIYSIERHISDPFFLFVIIHRNAVSLLYIILRDKEAQAFCLNISLRFHLQRHHIILIILEQEIYFLCAICLGVIIWLLSENELL